MGTALTFILFAGVLIVGGILAIVAMGLRHEERMHGRNDSAKGLRERIESLEDENQRLREALQKRVLDEDDVELSLRQRL